VSWCWTAKPGYLPGQNKKWDDEAIAKLNPGLKLPLRTSPWFAAPMVPVPLLVFTSYLAKVNEEWKSKIGAALPLTGQPVWAVKAYDGIAVRYSVCLALLVT
jgi:phosphate transport system substrate-binding protein